MSVNGSSLEQTNAMDFCTLGMFIIDEVHPSPTEQHKKPQTNIIGGAGTFAALGARLFSPSPTSSKTISWIIHAGPDFPPSISSELSSWRTHLLIKPREDATTRGWNGYDDNGTRTFKYLTPRKRLWAEDLTTEMLAAKSIHLVCNPERCVLLVERIRERRLDLGLSDKDFVVVWEPFPETCVPEEFGRTVEAMGYVDVVTPNHEEIASLFGHGDASVVSKDFIEQCSEKLLSQGVGPSGRGSVVVRAGKQGCYIASPGTKKWLPAYHQEANRVIDPTGGGNAFCGGLAIGLVRNDGDVVEAARWGNIAASFAIEQVGVPTLQTIIETKTCVDELWNGESVFDRLGEYRKRVS